MADETVEMFCSLDDEQLAARRAEWRALADRGLIETRHRADGFTTEYHGDEETARALDALVAAERGCCPGIEWRVEHDGDRVRLDVTYPATT